MKSLLWLLALFAAAVGVSLAMPSNDGYVLLVMPPYRFEVPLNLAILACLGAFLVLHGILRALSRVRQSLSWRPESRRERRLASERAMQSTSEIDAGPHAR